MYLCICVNIFIYPCIVFYLYVRISLLLVYVHDEPSLSIYRCSYLYLVFSKNKLLFSKGPPVCLQVVPTHGHLCVSRWSHGPCGVPPDMELAYVCEWEKRPKSTHCPSIPLVCSWSCRNLVAFSTDLKGEDDDKGDTCRTDALAAQTHLQHTCSMRPTTHLEHPNQWFSNCGARPSSGTPRQYARGNADVLISRPYWEVHIFQSTQTLSHNEMNRFHFVVLKTYSVQKGYCSQNN